MFVADAPEEHLDLIDDVMPEEQQKICDRYQQRDASWPCVKDACHRQKNGVDPCQPLDLDRDEEEQQHLKIRIQDRKRKEQCQVQVGVERVSGDKT